MAASLIQKARHDHSERFTAHRLITADLTGRVHSLPVQDATVHDLSGACWCEPVETIYTPDDARAGEHYHAWFHHQPN